MQSMSSMTKQYQSLLCMPLSFLLIILVASAEIEDSAFVSCDEDSIPSTRDASSLAPNRFHKICPPFLPASKPLGQPICGDGTAYSFLYSSPAQQSTQNEKILIEFSGGGACWDLNTCSQNESVLTFPTIYSDFVGFSCDFAQIFLQSQYSDINLLCDTQIGDVDMSGTTVRCNYRKLFNTTHRKYCDTSHVSTLNLVSPPIIYTF